MAKNANGEGSIYKWMKDGKQSGYKGAISYLDDQATTQALCRLRPHPQRCQTSSTRPVTGSMPVRPCGTPNRPVGDWLAHWRVTALAASDRKSRHKALYANLCRSTSNRHRSARSRWTSSSRPISTRWCWRCGPRPKTEGTRRRALSDSTIRQIYTVLRAGLDGAVRDGLIARNPGRAGDASRRRAPRSQALGRRRRAAVLKAAKTSRYYPALVLIAATGLRKGEALALPWDTSVDNLDEGWLKVRATLGRAARPLVFSEPKTDRSRRTVPLSPAVVAMLRKHARPEPQRQLRAGDQWQRLGSGVHQRAGRRR